MTDVSDDWLVSRPLFQENVVVRSVLNRTKRTVEPNVVLGH